MDNTLKEDRKNLLMIHQGALGDFITAFPALNLLRDKYQSIDAICQKKLGEMAAYLGIIDHHLPSESAAMASVYSESIHPGLKRMIASYHTIIIFSFSETLKKSISRLTGQKIHRIDPRPVPGKKVHVSAHLLDRLAAAGAISKAGLSKVVKHPSLEDCIRGSGYDASRVMLHPGSGSPKKNWPLANFIRLAAMLKAAGKQPVFICGPAESKMLPTLNESGYPVYPVDDLIALSKCLEQSGGFIGNDSGVSHLSAYLAVPTVTVFGPSDPIRWRPTGPSVAVVQTDPVCPPCFETDKDRCPASDCLTRISPDAVLSAYVCLLSKVKSPSAGGIRDCSKKPPPG